MEAVTAAADAAAFFLPLALPAAAAAAFPLLCRGILDLDLDLDLTAGLVRLVEC